MRSNLKNLNKQKEEIIKKKSGSTSLSYEDKKENKSAAELALIKAKKLNRPVQKISTKEAVRNSLKREFKLKHI